MDNASAHSIPGYDEDVVEAITQHDGGPDAASIAEG